MNNRIHQTPGIGLLQVFALNLVLFIFMNAEFYFGNTVFKDKKCSIGHKFLLGECQLCHIRMSETRF